jgi:HD-like signal output (HDOD) protein
MDARLPELERLMERDACDLKDIEAFVTADPSLVVTVIRASNAAYYRSPKLITNLRDAVVRIGNRQVFALLLETLVQRSFQVTSPEGRKVISGCWRNATLTARLVRRLAEWTGLGRPEDVYVAGLLHNLGEMVLIWRAIEGSASGLGARLEADAGRIAGTHESLGRIVATRWGLPPLVQILTGFHHTPRPGGRPEDEKLRLAVLATWALSRRVLGEYLPNQAPVDPDTIFDEMGLAEPLRQRLNDECTAATAGL